MRRSGPDPRPLQQVPPSDRDGFRGWDVRSNYYSVLSVDVAAGERHTAAEETRLAQPSGGSDSRGLTGRSPICQISGAVEVDASLSYIANSILRPFQCFRIPRSLLAVLYSTYSTAYCTVRTGQCLHDLLPGVGHY